jgi:hypothetical protein
VSASRLALAAAVALGTPLGCTLVPGTPQVQPVPAYFAGERDVDRVRRVMVLPFEVAPGVYANPADLREVLVAELAKLRRFELVPLPLGNDADELLYQQMSRGRISAEVLAELGTRYGIDGVLLGTITGYRPYTPPHLGVRLQLISLHTGAAVWATEVFYDAGNAATAADIEHFTYTVLAPESSMHGWELALISPNRFASFVFHRVVATWQDADYED